MKRFKSVFRPNTETSETSIPRHIWRRTPVKPLPETTATETGDDSNVEAGPLNTRNQTVSSEVAPVDHPQLAPQDQAQGTGELRSRYGTRRLKKVVQRFRASLSSEDDPITEPAQSEQPEETPEGTTVREKESGGPLSSNPLDQSTENQPQSTGKTIRFDSEEQGVRQVSGQTSNSQKSQQTQETNQTEDTVCHHPPDCLHPPERSTVSLDEDFEQWNWPGLMYSPEEGGRAREFSDPFADPLPNPLSETLSNPFSDGKGSEYRQSGSIPRNTPLPLAPGLSRRSPYQSRDGSRASEGLLEPIPEKTIDEIQHIDDIVESETPHRPPAQSNPRGSRAASSGSSSSGRSRASTLLPYKAIINFNRMAAQQGINVIIRPEGNVPPSTSPSLPANDPTSDPTRTLISKPAVNIPVSIMAASMGGKPMTGVPDIGNSALVGPAELEVQSRRGFFGRLRKSRSSLEPQTQIKAPKPKLRRMKTFANLRRDPMTVLQGKSLETLARLGGQSFIMIKDLGPPPLQLPACIVAAVMFLHRYGPDHPELFIECQDVKAAIRAYDGWASHVLEGEKMQDTIDVTMRVISMPRIGEQSVPVLSVAWALKSVLAGLPHGILGSVRLYQTLRDLFYAPIPEQSVLQVPSCLRGVATTVAVRVQLISLAVIGLATDMQRDLICTIFGLLDYLLHPESSLEGQKRAKETGTDPRKAVAPPQYQELIRAFAPLLLGQESRGRLGLDQELEENRVATLLIDHWHNVNRQLRFWSKDSYPGQ